MHDFSQLALHHQRVTIRRIYETDLPALFAVYADPAVMHFASDPPFTTMGMMAQFYASVLAGYTSGDYYELAIVFDQIAIGTSSLHSFTPDGQQVEIGYLLHRGYWRRGIMSDVLTLLVPYLFRQLPLMQVVADIDAENLPSRCLVTNLGFQPLPGSTKSQSGLVAKQQQIQYTVRSYAVVIPTRGRGHFTLITANLPNLTWRSGVIVPFCARFSCL